MCSLQRAPSVNVHVVFTSRVPQVQASALQEVISEFVSCQGGLEVQDPVTDVAVGAVVAIVLELVVGSPRRHEVLPHILV